MDEAEAGKIGGGGDGQEGPAELIVEEDKEVGGSSGDGRLRRAGRFFLAVEAGWG